MFPFLAPIKQGTHVRRHGTQIFVEFSSYADEPPSIETIEAETRSTSSASAVVVPSLRNLDDTSSIKSRNSESSYEKSQGSRPNSRAKSKTSLSSLPTSARSEKSSPLPPVAPVKETVPPISRHKNKGLEMSSGMMELFGGESAFGPGSAFEVIPSNPPDKNFHRKNMLGKDLYQKSTNVVEKSGENTESSFDQVESHDAAYQRAIKKARGQDLSQPGPEWYDGFEKMDMGGIELPDPNCPAKKFLQNLASKSSPDEPNDWIDAKEDVLAQSQKTNTTSTSTKFESLPGPDIGAEEEEEEEEEEPEIVAVDSPTAEDVEQKDGSEQGASDKQSRNGTSRRESDDDGRDADDESGFGGRDADNNAGGGGGEEVEKGQKQKDTACGSGSGEMSLLIKNAQIINDDAIFVSDVLVQDGVISNVASNIDAPAGTEIIDASGKMLLPAGIDVHTQLTAQQSADDLVTGCKAALAGGTATVVEVVTPRSGESLLAAFNRVKGSLDKAICNVSLSVTISQWSDATKSEMEKLVSEGVNSFIIELSDDDKIYQCFEQCRKLGTHVRILPENRSIVSILERKMLALGVSGPEGYPQSRPEELEADKVNNICVLSQLANCPISIISVCSAESMQSIERARGNGTLAHAEIATAAIGANGSGYLEKDLKQASAHLTDVPLRNGASDRLISALCSQPLVVCTSGHKAVSSASRTSAKDFTQMAKGTTGAEERMAVVWEKAVRSGKIDAMRFVAVTSSNAAKVFNLYPKKGRIAVGADADLVIWDGGVKRNLSASSGQSSVDVSVFDGMVVHAAVIATIVGGKVAWQDGSAKDPASGGFLALAPNSPYLFSMVSQRDKFGNVERVERDAGTSKPVQNGHNVSKAGDFDRDRNRKHLMESSIDFGGSGASRNRNPPGGRTTGFW